MAQQLFVEILKNVVEEFGEYFKSDVEGKTLVLNEHVFLRSQQLEIHCDRDSGKIRLMLIDKY